MIKEELEKVHRVDCQPLEESDCQGCRLAECHEVIRMLISELKYNPQRDSEDREQVDKAIKRAVATLPEFSPPPKKAVKEE